jgi:hypothetical protein
VRVVDVKYGKDIKPASLENISKLPIECDSEKAPAETTKQVKQTKQSSHMMTHNTRPRDQQKAAPRIWMRKPSSKQVKKLVNDIHTTDHPPLKRRKN